MGVMVWFLIIVSGYDSHMSTVAVPQISKEQCVSNVQFLLKDACNHDSHGYNLLVYSAYCIPGAQFQSTKEMK